MAPCLRNTDLDNETSIRVSVEGGMGHGGVGALYRGDPRGSGAAGATRPHRRRAAFVQLAGTMLFPELLQ